MIALLKRGKRTLPAELVAAIQGANIVFRCPEAEEGPRPLAWGLLEARPVYVDDPQALTKRFRRHFDLTDAQARRALVMIQAEVGKRQHEEPGSRRRRGWMRHTESLMPWEL